MNRLTNTATTLSIAVLLLAGAAHAQFNDQKITATIPFEFVAGTSTLPAGQYVFLRTGSNQVLVRDGEGHNIVTVLTGMAQTLTVPSQPSLKFETVDGAHVLVQIWNDHERIGTDLYRARQRAQEARYSAVHGSIAGRR